MEYHKQMNNSINKFCECGCGREVTINYHTKQPNRFISGHNKSWLGKFLSFEHKEKLSKICKSEEVQQKKEQTMMKNHGVKYAHQSKELRKNFEQTMIEKHGFKHALQSEKFRKKYQQTSLENYGFENYSHTDRFKNINRIAAIKRIEVQKQNNEPILPCIGISERLFLNELQNYTNYNIIRNDSTFRYVVGRFPDGHIPELKLFIQFDENHHFINNEYRQDDIECTLQLASLGYIVFRVSERDWKNNKDRVLNQFKELINNNLESIQSEQNKNLRRFYGNQ